MENNTATKIEKPYVSSKVSTVNHPAPIVISRDIRDFQHSPNFNHDEETKHQTSHPPIAW